MIDDGCRRYARHNRYGNMASLLKEGKEKEKERRRVRVIYSKYSKDAAL